MDALMIGLSIFSLGYLLSLARWFYNERKLEAHRRIAGLRLVASNPQGGHCAVCPKRRCRKKQPLSDVI